MAATIEEEVLGSLPLLDVNQLKNVYAELNLPDIADPTKQVKSNLLRKINNYLTSDEVDESEDSGLAHFQMIQTFMQTQDVRIKKEEPVVEPENGTRGGGAATLPKVAAAAAGDTGKSSHTFAAESKSDGSFTTDLTTLKSVLKKDFKVKGKIGSPGQKDRMQFSQVAYCINNAEKKGYSEPEICAGVIEAMDSDISLKSYLEGKTDLTLAKLRKFLRGHFLEKDSTSLFSMLANASQQSSQSASDFVFDLMDLRQRVVFVSKESNSDVQFNESLVQTQFIRSLISGLRNDNIRNELKPAVKEDIDDDDLIELVNAAISSENERSSKQKKHALKVNQLEAAAKGAGAEGEGSNPKKVQFPGVLKETPDYQAHPSTILKELREMKAQVNEMKVSKDELAFNFADLQKQLDQKPQRFRKYGCPACRNDPNVRARCTHCFKCGAGDHKKQDCPN